MPSLFVYYFLVFCSFFIECWMGAYSFFPKKVSLMTDPPTFVVVGRLPFYLFENTGETFNLFSALRNVISGAEDVSIMDSVFQDLLIILFVCFVVTWIFKMALILLSMWGFFCYKKVCLQEDMDGNASSGSAGKGEADRPKRTFARKQRFSLLFRMRFSILIMLNTCLLDLFYLFIHFACSFHSGYQTLDGFFVSAAPGIFSGVWIWLGMAFVDIFALVFLVRFYVSFVHQFERNILDAYGEPIIGRDDSSVLMQIKHDQRAFAAARKASRFLQVGQTVPEEEQLQRQLGLRSSPHQTSLA